MRFKLPKIKFPNIKLPNINFLTSYNRRNIKKFLIIVGSAVGAYVMVGGVVLLAIALIAGNPLKAVRPPLPQDGDSILAANDPDEGIPLKTAEPTEALPLDDEGNLLRPPSKTNILVMGIDIEAGLPDTIFVASFDRDACKLNILSIPRDTYTQIPSHRLERMRADGLHPPVNGIMKINHVRSYGGRTNGPLYFKEQVGEMLGVPINYYIEMDLDGFRDIVDALGGVEMEIPAGGLYYEDPFQNLVIAVPPGWQRLDGKMAEGVIRYRKGYSNGDVDRVRVQQEFMRQLFRQSLTRESIMNDPLSLANSIIKHVRTDIGMEFLKYLPYVSKFTSESAHFFILPGDGAYVGAVSYFLPDQKALPGVINEVFYAEREPTPTSAPSGSLSVASDSRDLRIAVLNGGRIAGLASSYADRMRNDGYNVVHVDNHSGAQDNQTRILVRKAGTGGDLTKYFRSAVVTEDTAIDAAYDIVIILGRRET